MIFGLVAFACLAGLLRWDRRRDRQRPARVRCHQPTARTSSSGRAYDFYVAGPRYVVSEEGPVLIPPSFGHPDVLGRVFPDPSPPVSAPDTAPPGASVTP